MKKRIVKEVEVKAVSEVETGKTETEAKPKNLLQVAEVRMVLYVVPVALAIWLFAYIYEHYIK